MALDSSPNNGGNKKWTAPLVVIGYLLAIAGSIIGGVIGTASYLGTRDTQLYNIEYRLGMVEKGRESDLSLYRSAQDTLGAKIDKIVDTLNCIKIRQANRNASCS